MSLFETVGVMQGRLLFEREHAGRLGLAATQLLGVASSAVWDEALAWASEIIPGRTGVLRVYLSAGEGGMCEPATAPGGWAIFEEMPLGVGGGDGAKNSEWLPGLRLCVSRAVCATTPGGWKTGNYWPNIRALAEAREAGCDEALVVNGAGQVIGCACANLFLLAGGKWVTPAGETGARDGVVRAWVMDRHPCEEAVFGVDFLAEADGAFVTNSRLGVAPVAEIDGRRLRNSDPAESLCRNYADEILHG